MVITSGGKIIRMPVGGIPTIGRNTQGVRLIRLDEGETVATLERLAEHEEEGERKEVDPAVLAAQKEREAMPLAEEEGIADEESDEHADGEAGVASDEPAEEPGEEPDGNEGDQ